MSCQMGGGERRIVLLNFNHINTMCYELYMLVAQIMRACLPLGLHASDQFKPISDGIGAPSILPPPMDGTEAELRRNIFWLAYSLERLSGCGNGWPLALDDQDISQFLPVSAMNFGLGVRTRKRLLPATILTLYRSRGHKQMTENMRGVKMCY